MMGLKVYSTDKPLGVFYPEIFSDIYIARVENINDPLKLGRVQLTVPQILGTAISNWAWPIAYGVPVSAGQIVYVAFIGGDRNKPAYFAQAQKNVSAGSSSNVSPQTLVNGSTISTVNSNYSLINNSGAVTGIIMQTGILDGQLIWIVNESGNNVTFAASGSNVADGSSDVISGGTARGFIWSATNNLWYRWQ